MTKNTCLTQGSHLQAAVKEGESHLASLQGSLASEAKSTAGDKHETGRAMIHQEMRQVNDTLQRSQSALDELTRLRQVSIAPVRVASGVLVETTGPWVLVGLPFGKLSLAKPSCWASVGGTFGAGMAWRSSGG